MTKRGWLILLFVVAAAIVALLIFARPTPEAARSPEKLAVLTDLSAYTAEYGQQELAGLQLLQEDAAAARRPARRISLDVQDTKGNPRDALNGISQILSRPQRPLFVFSALSSVSTAILPTADRANLLTLSNATTDSILRVSPNAIRNFPSPEAEFSSLFEGAARPLQLRSLGLIYIDDEYGRAMAALFRARAGAAAALTEGYGFELTDFRPIVAKAIASRADGIIIVGYASQAGSLIRQLRTGGYEGRILVPSLIVNTDSVASAAGANLEGVIFNGFDYQPTPEARRLLQRFGSRYRGRQSDIGILAYVGAGIVLDHARQGRSPSEVIAQLDRSQPFDTILGSVAFRDRSFVYPLRLYEVRNRNVSPFDPARR